MIYGRLPQSHGQILMEGKPVKKGMIALCPQFDDHLSPELTGYENLRFYSLLYGIGFSEFEKLLKNIIKGLDLEEHINKMISQMSGGNQRKISIAIALMSSSPLILLDEPTSSLDPTARQHVHDLITRSKGNKTFILCTHLLSEAEKLCDNIAIIIKGCVYTYGTPQFLTSHFGREWKLDVLIDDVNYSETVKGFIEANIPTAKFSFERHRTLVFSIPSETISLTQVFEIMQRAIDTKIGVSYFTCSSCTLEKVFMELVKIADTETNLIEPAKEN
ncbi:ABC transporter family protein [Trichomonas vaginalis G3]|uniref:ABC transporter family protein n=1 Tax=Trichomonas vaginalis (strain ATCC PRA-98 / G3) TaxID=412133 RepID=A2FU48_TRIV3|nr:ABC transporter family protein [Trichomonas vaginalis G3]|eukprot:XP_001304500.1 ABC transporter family protein [Trichomonas vaginalis G3]